MAFGDPSIARLRQRAEHCRDLAGGAIPHAVVAELCRLADEYESQADGFAGKLAVTPGFRANGDLSLSVS